MTATRWCIPALALLAVVTLAATAAALPTGCDRDAVEDGLELACTFHPRDADGMRDTFVRSDRPTGQYGLEARLDLLLHATDRSRAGIIYLDWPALPVLRNATIDQARITLTVQSSDLPPGATLELGAYPIGSEWPESVPWPDRPDPRSPWRAGPAMDTWRMPVAGVSSGDTASWDLVDLFTDRLVANETSHGVAVTNTSRVRDAPGGPAFHLRFDSSRADVDRRPTLELRAKLPAPRVQRVEINDTVLWQDGGPTGAVYATNGQRDEVVRVVVHDEAAPPDRVRLNLTGTRGLVLPLVDQEGATAVYEMHGPLLVANGLHRVHVWALDPDGYPVNVTGVGRSTSLDLGPDPVLRVDRDPPVIRAADAPTQIDEGETRRVTVRADEVGGSLPLTARAVLKVGSTERAQALTETTTGRFAGDVEFRPPGNATLTIEVRDAAGNTATVDAPVHVVDMTAPTLGPGVRFASVVTELGDPAAELGHPIELVAPAADDTPVRVRIRAEGPETIERTAPVDTDGAARVTLEPALTGVYSVTVVAENIDGVRSQSQSLRLRVLDPAPPEVQLPEGIAPDVVAPATVLTVTVLDAALDPDRVHINLTADGRLIDADEQRSSRGGRLEATLRPGPLANGTRLAVHVVATDALDQRTETSREWTVDGRGPVVRLTTDGPAVQRAGTLHVATDTRFIVDARDALLPVRDPAVRVTIPTVSDVLHPAVEPLPATKLDLVPDRPVQVRAEARDLAGNPGTSPELTVNLDARPPEIGIEATPDGLVLTASDDGAGLAALRVRAAIGGGPYQQVADETFEPGTTNARFTVPSDAPRGTRAELVVRAEDVLGNVESHPDNRPLVVTVPNHPPSIRVDAPAAATTVSGTIELAWTSRDLDGDLVHATVEVVRVLDGSTIPVVRDHPGSTLDVDTTRFLNGPHRITVTVTDGVDRTSTEIVVTTANPGRDAGEARTSLTQDGLVVEVPVGRSLTRMTLQAQPPTGPAIERTMRDDGFRPDLVDGDGIWTATVPADAAGRYTFTVQGTGADGSTFVAEVGDADVPGVAIGPLVPWLLGLTIVAGATGVGVALWRFRAGGRHS